MISAFSFFTGAGFLDLGLEHEGFTIDFVNEFDPGFLRAYRHSRSVLGSPEPTYGHHCGSVEDFLTPAWSRRLQGMMRDARRHFGMVGFLGGPPCPDFSVAGKNAGSGGDNGRLSEVYAKMIKRHRPDFFIFENVEGLWRTRVHREFYDAMKAGFESCGYVLHDRLVNCIRYGVCQDRRRIFLVGILGGSDSVDFPWEANMVHPEGMLKLPWPGEEPFGASHRPMPDGLPRELTVQHWFERNVVTHHPNAHHFFKPRAALPKFQVIPEGSVRSKSFKRLHRWRYSPTAAYGNNEVHLHPYEARRISAAEALAIQSLPATFEFPADMTLSAMFKTIGNGVPYMAARGLGRTLLAHLESWVPEIAEANPLLGCLYDAGTVEAALAA